MNCMTKFVHPRSANRKNHGYALPVLVLTLTLLSACSASEPVDDLAVAKMPTSEMQATNYLPLNEDKPGTPVNVPRYLAPGRYNIVEYYSPYDANCANLQPLLVQLAQTRNDIAIRTVNVNRPEIQQVDWGSQVMLDLQIQKLPYFQIYDLRQGLRAQGRPAYEQVNQWVRSLQSTQQYTGQPAPMAAP